MFKTHRTYDLTTGVKSSTIAVFNQGKVLTVIYHKTPVVIKAGSTIVLNNGGWDTVSTRAVINRALSLLAPNTFLVRKRIKGETRTYLESTDINGITKRVEFTRETRLKVFA